MSRDSLSGEIEDLPHPSRLHLSMNLHQPKPVLNGLRRLVNLGPRRPSVRYDVAQLLLDVPRGEPLMARGLGPHSVHTQIFLQLEKSFRALHSALPTDTESVSLWVAHGSCKTSPTQIIRLVTGLVLWTGHPHKSQWNCTVRGGQRLQDLAQWTRAPWLIHTSGSSTLCCSPTLPKSN